VIYLAPAFVPDITKRFWEEILIKPKILQSMAKTEYSNNIILKSYLIFGLQGSGKTTLANSIVKKYYDAYGDENVNAIESDHGNIEYLISMLEDKVVNILFADNITLQDIPKEAIRKYFSIRHILGDFYPKRKKKGLIIFLFGLHRIHGMPAELRTNLDGIIIKDSALFGWDRSFLKRLVGENVLKSFDYISRYRLSDKRLYKIGYFYSKVNSGFFKSNIEKKYYFNDFSSPEYTGDIEI